MDPSDRGIDLAGALELGDRELVSLVGAGGKKTAMASLADSGAARGLEVGYTTTVKTPPPDYPLVLSGRRSPSSAVADATSPVAFARRRVEDPERADEKVVGFDPATVDRVFESGRFDWLLVKADGARTRGFKAPGEGEPPVPAASTVVAPVASVRVVGRSLTERRVHRPERVAAITGLAVGDRIGPADVGAVLASPEGGLKNVPDPAEVVPILNKADDGPLRETARAVLEAVFDRSERVDRGLVTSFREGHLAVHAPEP